MNKIEFKPKKKNIKDEETYKHLPNYIRTYILYIIKNTNRQGKTRIFVLPMASKLRTHKVHLRMSIIIESFDEARKKKIIQCTFTLLHTFHIFGYFLNVANSPVGCF